MSTSVQTPWQAPLATRPVDADVVVPGSKSQTNRAYLLAALADGPSTLTEPLTARDTSLMIDALRSLGTSIDLEADHVHVTPAPFRGPASVDCGLAGTVMRFVPPVAALTAGDVHFDGDPRQRERPMGQLLDALRVLGVAINGADRLPFTIAGSGSVAGGVVTLDASASSQFVSALLLAGARYDQGIDIRHDGKPMPSAPHVEMTLAMLRARGVAVDDSEPNRWRIAPGPISAVDCVIEPDLSNAAPFVAAAAVTGGRVTIPGWPTHTTQPGDQLRGILALMGCDVEAGPTGVTVTGRATTLSGVDLDLHDVGELTPVVAALCALADGPSHLRGIAHLRGHETDRLAALATELTLLGCDARETPDGLEIRPRPLTGTLVRTYADHRMAQAAAVLGLVVPGIQLDDVATTSKTHPAFVEAWTAMLA